MSVALPSIWTPSGISRLAPWWRLPRLGGMLATALHLKKRADGHLMKNAAGHLAKTCPTDEPACCVPVGTDPPDWTLTIAGLTMCGACTDNGTVSWKSTGDANGTHCLPSLGGGTWQLQSAAAQFLHYQTPGDTTCTTLTQTNDMQIRLQHNGGGSMTFVIQGWNTQTGMRMFDSTTVAATNYPCDPVVFTNPLASCGIDGGGFTKFAHGGTATLTACC